MAGGKAGQPTNGAAKLRRRSNGNAAPHVSRNGDAKNGGNLSTAFFKHLLLTLAAFRTLQLFSARNVAPLAEALHRLGWLSRPYSALVQELHCRAAAGIAGGAKRWGPHELANACWAAARARHAKAPKLFDAVATEAPKKIQTFSPQALANTAWAYATARVSAPALFEAVAAETVNKIATFNAQNLAKTAWAYATAGVLAPALFEAVAAEAPTKMATFEPQALANTVWAFTKAGVPAPLLFEAVAAEAVAKIATFDAQNLANIVWAYATAGVVAPLLFKAVASEAPKKMATFNSQALANIVWAFATAGFEAPALFEAVALAAPKKMAAFNSQALANMVWAYATVGVEAPLLFVAVAAEAPKKIRTFHVCELANVAWAYSTAEEAEPALFEVIAWSIGARMDELSEQGLWQMYLVYILLKVEAPFHALTRLLSHHEAGLREAFLRIEACPRRVRGGMALARNWNLEREHVSASLQRIGWEHDFGHVTAEGIRLDMAAPSCKLAVELDGPAHYLRSLDGCDRALDGASKFKERLLLSLGWQLIRVPYFEWYALRSQALQDAYFRTIFLIFARDKIHTWTARQRRGRPGNGTVNGNPHAKAPPNKARDANGRHPS